jgi:hypothetical protein
MLAADDQGDQGKRTTHEVEPCRTGGDCFVRVPNVFRRCFVFRGNEGFDQLAVRLETREFVETRLKIFSRRPRARTVSISRFASVRTSVIAHHQKTHEGISAACCTSHVRDFCVLAIRKSVDSSGA